MALFGAAFLLSQKGQGIAGLVKKKKKLRQKRKYTSRTESKILFCVISIT